MGAFAPSLPATMRPTTPVFPRSTRRSSILSQPSGRRSKSLIQNATVVLVGLPIEELRSAIRDSRKPVIARVQGYAIGGGNVLATVCDLTIASEKAVFGQVGPRVGSVDPGWGTAYLARHVGDKRAREIWLLCRRYSAAEAFQMGLVNKVVPAEELDAEVESWCREILA